MGGSAYAPVAEATVDVVAGTVAGLCHEATHTKPATESQETLCGSDDLGIALPLVLRPGHDAPHLRHATLRHPEEGPTQRLLVASLQHENRSARQGLRDALTKHVGHGILGQKRVALHPMLHVVLLPLDVAVDRLRREGREDQLVRGQWGLERVVLATAVAAAVAVAVDRRQRASGCLGSDTPVTAIPLVDDDGLLLLHGLEGRVDRRVGGCEVDAKQRRGRDDRICPQIRVAEGAAQVGQVERICIEGTVLDPRRVVVQATQPPLLLTHSRLTPRVDARHNGRRAVDADLLKRMSVDHRLHRGHERLNS
mmetsp:Transcript_16550/g.47084  ORF Transcript_16550/g.47084 Transcript_16550/m.47084 type:complete len:310 (+) Transcript_16550:216-1145(+)